MKLMTSRNQLNLFNTEPDQTIGNGESEPNMNSDDTAIINHDSNDSTNLNQAGNELSTGAPGAKKRGKRKPNPDKDKYIQEPQYVTKRTSSGRLVKMKISTDYDYTSDQELEAKKKKSMFICLIKH
jgi:hypothetical protein